MFVLAAIHIEVDTQAREDHQRDDLRHQASDHDVDALVQESLLCCDSGDRAAGALQDNGYNVGGDEDIGVGVRCDTRVLGPVECDESLKHDVQAGGEESRSDREQDDVDLEAQLREWVVVQQESSDVSYAWVQ